MTQRTQTPQDAPSITMSGRAYPEQDYLRIEAQGGVWVHQVALTDAKGRTVTPDRWEFIKRDARG